MSLKIRPAQASDLAALMTVHQEAAEQAYQGLVPLAAADKRQQVFQLLLAQRATLILVAEVDQHVVAFAQLQLPVIAARQSAEAELAALYVHPDYWRQGIGRQLVCAVLDWLRLSDHWQTLQLWVLSENQTAWAFYQQLGFCPDNLVKRHLASGAELARLSLPVALVDCC